MKSTSFRAASAGIFALVATLAMSSPAAAQTGLLQSVPAAEAQSAASQGPELGNLVRRSRVVRLDTSELGRHIMPLEADAAPDRVARSNALDGIIRIELFPGTTAIFRRHSVDETPDNGIAWVGRVRGSILHYASLIVDDSNVTGHIQLMHRLFQIYPLGGGLHKVIEIDQSKFPPDDAPGQKTTEPDQHGAKEDAAPKQEAAPAPEVTSQVTVLAAYTTAAKNQAGGLIAIRGQINQAVSLANTGYANTGIPLRVKLVKIMAAGTYRESADIAVDLNRLDGGSTVLQNVRNARETVRADLVSLWRKSDPSFCGIANLTDRPNATTTRNLAYHVMNWTCVSNLSFHHEMGHNMGLRHDYYVDPTPGVRYNHGYVNRTNTCRIRTIMAYNNECVDKSGFNCTRVNAFSTGNFVWNPGSCKLGINKAGTLKRMDNTQRLKETRGAIAKYRL